jgi:hypothetical protein
MSLAEMPTNSSVPKASPEDASAYARLSGDPDFLNLDDDQKVETLYFEGWEVSRIARTLRMRREDVQQYCEVIDDDMEWALEDSPDAIKRRQSRALRSIAANVMASRAVKENPKLYLVAMKAMADERKMLGLDAPVKTANLSVTAHTMVQPGDMQKVLGNERVRQALLVIEQETAGYQLTPGDLAREVRRDRLAGDVEEGQAP